MEHELLQALSDMMDEKFGIVNEKLDTMGQRMDSMEHRLEIVEFKQDRTAKKLDDLQLDVKIFERDIRKDVHSLRDEMDTVIELLKIHKIVQL